MYIYAIYHQAINYLENTLFKYNVILMFYVSTTRFIQENYIYFLAYRQHDIQELCRVMFDALEKCWRDTKQKTLIKDLYEGNISDCVKCLEVCCIEVGCYCKLYI